MNRRNLLIGSALLLAGCNDKQVSLPGQKDVNRSTWTWVNSQGMAAPQEVGGRVIFSLTGEPHMLVKAVSGLPQGNTVKLVFTFEGEARPIQGSVATVSLFFQRSGDNWSGVGEFANYRWYHAGVPLRSGTSSLEAKLAPEHWGNVQGKHDGTAFVAALRQASAFGLAFGDPGAGATAHGIRGTGQFSFTLEGL